jgi:hypothetical protein
MRKNIIISVESRKGGVGKTTAALCIGKSLLKEGYAVLLFDTDITGTNIADCANSPFWHDCLKILTVPPNGPNANLLNLFEEDFMNGNKLPSFQDNNNGFSADLAQINVFGSQIYSQDGKPATICKPAILFDQLHGYWFVDFLKEIAEDFAATIKDKPVAVVLDNSPGYVGIAPAIQDWLTDLGPETGKFLVITSLDSQDMQSCATAISVLHEQYKEKWNTGCMFLKAKNGNGEKLDYSLMKGDFFVKLTEYEESNCNIDSKFPVPFAFYIDRGERNKPTESGSEFSEFPEKYIGVIINRVPQPVFKHRRTYQPELLKNDSLLLNLLGGHYSREWSKYMVGYDVYIEDQFLQAGMSKNHYRKRWIRNLQRLLMRNDEIFHDKEFLRKNMSSPESFSRMNNYISQFQNIIDAAIDAMRANGLDHLIKLIDDDWKPKSIVPNLQTAFYNFMENVDPPFFKEMYWEEFDNERIIEKHGVYRLDRIMHTLELPFDKMAEHPEIMNTIFYLIASLPLPVDRKMPLEEEFMVFVRTIIEIESSLLRENENRYNDLARILSSDICNKINLKEFLNKFEFPKRIRYHSKDEFLDFFISFASAQARLMRLPEDTSFLIWLIQTMAEFENKKPNALPYVRKIAEDVILNKTLSYDSVREKSSKALSEAQYFVDFEKAIRNITDRWGIK